MFVAKTTFFSRIFTLYDGGVGKAYGNKKEV